MKISILSTRAYLGGLWLALLLIACFFLVHLARLAKFGWLYQKTPPAETKQEPPQKTEPKKTTPEQSVQEPIYYIVERKKKPRSSYSEPKQIRFK